MIKNQYKKRNVKKLSRVVSYKTSKHEKTLSLKHFQVSHKGTPLWLSGKVKVAIFWGLDFVCIYNLRSEKHFGTLDGTFFVVTQF